VSATVRTAEAPDRVAAWHTLCHLLDGLAIGTTVAAFERSGVLAALASGPVDAEELAARLGLRPGYLALGLRLLAVQGFAVRRGSATALTPPGRDWLRHVASYRRAPQEVAAAAALLRGEDPPPFTASVPAEGIGERVRLHGLAPRALSALTRLVRDGALDAAAGGDWPDAARDPAVLAPLRAVGWIEGDGRDLRLTPQGLALPAIAPQAWYTVSYMPLLARVPDLLTGRAAAMPDGAGEAHLDRLLDIRFSGVVYARTCRTPLRALVLPLLAAPDAPRALVDVGCGDATMLCDLHAAAVEAGVPAPRPVGVEFTDVALEEAGRRLAPLGGIAVRGDIGAPDAIYARLADLGLARDDCLMLSKSVVHDRAFAGRAVPLADPISRGVFVAPDGGLLSAAAVEADLTEFFGRWSRSLGCHGMVCIETHLLPEESVAAVAGATPIAGMEATHGYSHQYLVEAEAHRRAALRGGLVSAVRQDLLRLGDRPLTTLDRYLAATPGE
jgi:hypothetical protein